MSSEERRVHVVMLVENEITIDARVQKSAAALARAGLKVTLVGYAPDGKRSDSRVGPCQAIRIPVPTPIGDAHVQRRARRRRVPRVFGYVTPAEARAARLHVQARQRAVTAASGRAVGSRDERGGLLASMRFRLGVVQRQAVRSELKVALRWVGVRQNAQRRLASVLGNGWKAWDRGMSRTRVAARWRRVLPGVNDYEMAFGPVIDRLEPDAIHAHDVRMVGIAAAAAARARLRDRRVPWIYDAHEYVRGLSLYGRRTPRVVAAWESLEREYIRDAEAVITVSPPIAVELQRCYGLAERPTVVLNIPVATAADAPGFGPSLRRAVGLDPAVPLLVYSGKVTRARGVSTVVEALRFLDGVHLAVVSVPNIETHAVRELRKDIERAGVSERVHLVDPVPPDDVVQFLSSATLGLIPLLHFGSHEMALTNKLFEYLHAGLPVVVSDCKAQQDFVRETGTGESFVAEDALALAAAVRTVLEQRERYRAAITPDLLREYSWERQEVYLRDLYRRILGERILLPEDEIGGRPVELLPDVPGSSAS